jgi:hypothetical protein
VPCAKIIAKVIDRRGKYKHLVKVPVIDDNGLPDTPVVVYVHNKIAIRISTTPLTYELQGMAFHAEVV